MNIEEVVFKIDPERDYVLSEVADMFPVSKTTMANYIKRGIITGRLIFGKWYVKGKDVRAYLIKKCD